MAERRRIQFVYEKKKNEKMYLWFEKYGLKFLEERCGEGATITYSTDENGINVKIRLKKILILPDYDQELFRLMRKAGICSVKAEDQGWMEIKLWFRGWIWVKKEKEK